MSMCDKFENWRMFSHPNKLDALQEAAIRLAEDYGVPWPEVKSGVPDFPETPEDDSQKAAAYDPDTDTIYINENLINDPDPQQALHELGHEFAHEMHKEGWFDEDHPDGSSEEFADAYGDDYTDEMNAKCRPKPPQSPGLGGDDDGDDDDEEGDGGDGDGGGGDTKPQRQDPSDWDLAPEGIGYA